MPETPKPAAANGRPREDLIAGDGYDFSITSPLTFAQDRAAVIAAAVTQLIFRAPTPRDLRAQIEALLREELADVERQVLGDTRLRDP
jgi:hypothetical protein